MKVIDGSTSNTAALQVYEAKTVKAVSESRKKQLETLKEQIESLQKEFTAMSAMEDFRGNGATAIKEFYKAHATIADHWVRFLQARIAFLDQIADDQEEKDLGGETAVVMPFLTGDMQTAHYRSIEMVSQQQDDLQRIFDSISDILPLNVFSKASFTAHMEDANEGRKDTMKATQELDQQLTGEYNASGGEIENIIGLMNGLMEATRSGNDISPVHFNSSDFLNSEAYRNREEISARTEEYIGFKKEQKEQREIIAEMEALENRSAWEKLWDTTKTFTGELTGYYDYLRAEKGIDPVTGEKLTTTQRVAAGSMAAAGYIPVIGWFGKGIKGAKAINNTARASNAAAHALDAYRTKEAMSFVSMGEKGIYGLIAANEAKGYLTGTDLLGEEVSEDSQGLANSLSLAGILGVGRLVRSGNVGVVSGRGVENVKPGDKSSLAPGGGLAAHEAMGGHLIERHVGKTNEELLERIKSNPRINGSSTFNNRAIAEKVADDVLSDSNNKKAVEEWLSNSQSKSNLVLIYEGTDIIGRGVKRGSTNIEDMTNARIVLKKSGDGSFILTGYPN